MKGYKRVSKGNSLISDDTIWIERELFKLINKERIFHGLEKLIWDPDLATVARQHSADQSLKGCYGHNIPNSSFNKRRDAYLKLKKGQLHLFSENIYYLPARSCKNGPLNSKWETLTRAHSGWMLSVGHRNNILYPSVKFVGIGVVYNGSMYYFLTENFSG